MSDKKQMTLYGSNSASDLVNRYEKEFKAHRAELNLTQKVHQTVNRRSFSISKAMIGSLLAMGAIAMVFSSHYLTNQWSTGRHTIEQPVEKHSWVFPAYFMAGLFSVSSVLAFKRAIR